jgi:hypothetical protein
MALTPNESTLLATLSDEVSRMAGTVDDLLALLRTAGQNGPVDIATHNNNAAAHPNLGSVTPSPNTLARRDANAQLSGVAPTAAAHLANKGYVDGRTRIRLTADTTFYLSSTGNDANDGTALAKAKGTAAGLQALLASIDAGGYVVTVIISGVINGSLRLFVSHLPNFIIRGITETTDNGMTGTVLIYATGDTDIRNLRCQNLTARTSGHMTLAGKIKFVSPANTTTAQAIALVGGQITVGLQDVCSIDYSGVYTDLAVCFDGFINFNLATFTQSGDLTYRDLARVAYTGEIAFATCDATAITTPPTTATLFVMDDGSIAYGGLTVAGAITFFDGQRVSIQSGTLGNQSQKWTDVTPSRELNTVYTNTTTKPIMATCHVYITSGNIILGCVVNNATVERENISSINSPGSICAIVPPGGQYSYTSTGTYTIANIYFRELR